MSELKKASDFFDNNELKRADEIVDLVLGSGIYFPDTYISGLILKSRLLTFQYNDAKKGLELALEAETLSAVEDNASFLIDSKLAILENLQFQSKLETIQEKIQEVNELMDSFDDSDKTKNQKMSNFNTIKSKFEKSSMK